MKAVTADVAYINICCKDYASIALALRLHNAVMLEGVVQSVSSV
jgi:hypothetical protein